MSDALEVGMPFSADKKTGFAAASDLHPGLLIHRVVDCHHLKPTRVCGSHTQCHHQQDTAST